jgi:serine-type D-Ala-D-Ala carboxypeptidase/endopeptidase
MRWLAFLLTTTLWAQTNFSELDTILNEAQAQIGGISFTLTQHGVPIYERSYGVMTQNRLLAIASASKWLSAGVVMSVVDEGRISLDDPISKYLPYFAGDKATITIRQAFSHTAGFGPDTEEGSGTRCVLDRTTTLDACAREIALIPLAYPPGTAFAYGSYSMQVVGRVLEVVTGRPFAQLFQERIAAPLGMTSTYAAAPGRDTNPLLAGGYGATGADYTRYLTMILNRGVSSGRRILSANSVIEMQKDQTRGARIAFSPYSPLDMVQPGLGQIRYGIGEWLDGVVDGTVRSVSSQGAFGFSPFVDMDRNLTGVLAVQGQLRDVEPYYLRLRAAIERAIPVAGLPSRGVVNAGSFQMGAVAPGELITLFGSNLGPAQLAVTPTIAMPTELAGARVLLDGVAVPILYTSAGQLTALVPTNTAGRTAVSIAVEYRGADKTYRAGPVVMPLEAAAPGLFGVVVDRGVALIFGTGSPARHDQLAVSIGGRNARVLYAGPAPGTVNGVFQINAEIPSGTPASAEVIVRYGTIATQVVRLP